MVADPNGVGKTTFACRYVPLLVPTEYFFNANKVKWNRDVAYVEAGRKLILEINDAEELCCNVVIQITLE